MRAGCMFLTGRSFSGGLLTLIMRTIFLLTLLTLGTLHAADDVLLKDDFATEKHATRRALRGDWKFQDGAAICTQDDELYKQHKDHGPILFYDLEHQDAVVRFSFKAEAAKTVVFTANSPEGHVFRFVLSERGTSVRAFPTEVKDHKSIALANEKSPALQSGVWVPVEVRLMGAKAVVKIGADFMGSYEHTSLARVKSNLSIGFSFGTVAVKDLVVTRP